MQETNPRFKLNDTDNSYWLKRVLSRPDHKDREVEATQSSHRRIDGAAELARKHVEHLVATSSNPTEKLSGLVEYLAENVRIIWIQAPDDANAFVIFETLNDRGMELAISDLLKNYLFLLTGDRISEAQQSWIRMIGILEAVADDSA